MDSKDNSSADFKIMSGDPLISPQLTKALGQALNNGDYSASVISEIFRRNRMAAKRYARNSSKIKG